MFLKLCNLFILFNMIVSRLTIIRACSNFPTFLKCNNCMYTTILLSIHLHIETLASMINANMNGIKLCFSLWNYFRLYSSCCSDETPEWNNFKKKDLLWLTVKEYQFIMAGKTLHSSFIHCSGSLWIVHTTPTQQELQDPS